MQAIEDKKMLVVTGEGGNIQAASAIFEYGGEGEYREYGAVLVAWHLRGYGIMRTLGQVQSLSEEVLDPGFKTLFAVVKATNTPSIRNLCKIGFTERDPDAFVRGLKDLNGRYYFELPRHCCYQHAVDLLAIAEKPRSTRCNGDSIELHLDVKILDLVWQKVLRTYADLAG
jgi:hypothetical protein